MKHTPITYLKFFLKYFEGSAPNHQRVQRWKEEDGEDNDDRH